MPCCHMPELLCASYRPARQAMPQASLAPLPRAQQRQQLAACMGFPNPASCCAVIPSATLFLPYDAASYKGICVTSSRQP